MESMHDVLMGLEPPPPGMMMAGSYGIVECHNATLQIVPEEHAGRIVTLNVAEGTAVQLPHADGTGNVYRFYVGVDFTGPTVFKTDEGEDLFAGIALMSAPALEGGARKEDAKHGRHKEVGEGKEAPAPRGAAQAIAAFHPDADSNTLTLDGTTTGGLKGDCIQLVDIAHEEWQVEALLRGNASPFSATGAKRGNESHTAPADTKAAHHRR